MKKPVCAFLSLTLATSIMSSTALANGEITDLPSFGSDGGSAQVTQSSSSSRPRSNSGSSVKSDVRSSRVSAAERYSLYKRILEAEGSRSEADEAFAFIESQTIFTSVRTGTEIYLRVLNFRSGLTREAIELTKLAIRYSGNEPALEGNLQLIFDLNDIEGSLSESVQGFEFLQRLDLSRLMGLKYSAKEYSYLLRFHGGLTSQTIATMTALNQVSKKTGTRFDRVRATYEKFVSIEGSHSEALSDLEVIAEALQVSGNFDEASDLLFEILRDQSGLTAQAHTIFRKMYLGR